MGEAADRPLNTYSSGMVARLAFAIGTSMRPDILLIDEILSVGDQHFQKKSLEQMLRFRDEGRTFVFVSHSLGAVESICERALLLWEGRVVADGPAPEIVARYQAMNAEFEQAQERGLRLVATG